MVPTWRLRLAMRCFTHGIVCLLVGLFSVACPADVHGQWPSMAAIRLGAPGLWSAGVAGRVQLDRPVCHAAVKWSLAKGQAGPWSGGFMSDFPVDDKFRLGAGVFRHGQGLASIMLGGADKNCAFQIHIPVIQPSAQPYGASAWCGCNLTAVQWPARVQLVLRRGGHAALRLSVKGAKWEVWMGSEGVAVFRTWSRQGRPDWRLGAGALRGDIPWTGADWGGTDGMGSDPSRWMALDWLDH